MVVAIASTAPHSSHCLRTVAVVLAPDRSVAMCVKDVNLDELSRNNGLLCEWSVCASQSYDLPGVFRTCY